MTTACTPLSIRWACAQGVRRCARRSDPLGERRHGYLRPVDPRRVHGYRVRRCRTYHRPQAAQLRSVCEQYRVRGRNEEALAAALLALAACTRDRAEVDTSVIGAGDDWDNPGGDWAGSHFSRLTDITPANVGELGLAWEYDLGTARVQEATPVVIDGVMYTSGNLGRVYALNAATGEELWTFDARGRHAGQPRGLLRPGQPRRAGRMTARSSSPRSTAGSTRSTPRPAKSRGRPTPSPTASAATR